MNLIKYLILIVYIYSFSTNAKSIEKETVTWLKWEQAPNLIFKGYLKVKELLII